MVWSIGLLAVLIGLDQALKYWTVTHLALGESAELIPGFLQLTRLHNYGAAWSSLSGKVVALLVVTGVLMVAHLYNGWFPLPPHSSRGNMKRKRQGLPAELPPGYPESLSYVFYRSTSFSVISYIVIPVSFLLLLPAH